MLEAFSDETEIYAKQLIIEDPLLTEDHPVMVLEK